MSRIKDVSGTAFVVAEYRAEENREPTLIYTDSVVELSRHQPQAHRSIVERVDKRSFFAM